MAKAPDNAAEQTPALSVPKLIAKKRDGGRFTRDEIEFFVRSVSDNSIEGSQLGMLCPVCAHTFFYFYSHWRETQLYRTIYVLSIWCNVLCTVHVLYRRSFGMKGQCWWQFTWKALTLRRKPRGLLTQCAAAARVLRGRQNGKAAWETSTRLEGSATKYRFTSRRLWLPAASRFVLRRSFGSFVKQEIYLLYVLLTMTKIINS